MKHGKALASGSLLLCFALALFQDTSAQSTDAQALQGLQSCIQASKNNIPVLSGWGVNTGNGFPTGRKLLQCGGPFNPCLPSIPNPPPGSTSYSYSYTSPPSSGSGTSNSSTVPTVPAGFNPFSASTTNPCGDSTVPTPWTGLVCANGRVISVVIPQLGPNIFRGTCNVGNLSGLAGLSAVKQVDFTNAGLYGTVPLEWSFGNWSTSIETLSLAQNRQVNGTIPDISGLTALQSFDISSSGFFGGFLPTFNASFNPSLKSFAAAANKLGGPLPDSLPVNLTSLTVPYNQFNGSLPAYTSGKLNTFQVQNNTLSGCVPDAWTTGLTNLTKVDLSNNTFFGPIPTTWQASGSFPALQTINLGGNLFCGSTGALGTPVPPVGQNNSNYNRLSPSITFPACTGTEQC